MKDDIFHKILYYSKPLTMINYNQLARERINKEKIMLLQNIYATVYLPVKYCQSDENQK